jgi:hypothetical protein
MGKFKKYGGVSEWDGILSDYANMITVIHNLTRIRTKQAEAYVATCDVFDGEKQVVDHLELLVPGGVTLEQLDNYLLGSEGHTDMYPFSVILVSIERKGMPNYWLLKDGEDTDE